MNDSLLGLILSGLALSAAAAEPPARSLEERLTACGTHSDAGERLACYDGIASAVMLRPKEAATPAPPEASPAFGVRNGPLDVHRQAVEPKEMSASVSQISRRTDGTLVFVLDNGQAWAQNQSVEYFPLGVGERVIIRSAALGSYMLFTPSKRSTHVTRIR